MKIVGQIVSLCDTLCLKLVLEAFMAYTGRGVVKGIRSQIWQRLLELQIVLLGLAQFANTYYIDFTNMGRMRETEKHKTTDIMVLVSTALYVLDRFG